MFIMVLLAIASLAWQCTKKICSAYQSAFLIDQSKVHRRFTGFNDTSKAAEPIEKWTINKTNYLLIKPLSRRMKEKSWELVPMVTIFPGAKSKVDTSGGKRPEEALPDSTPPEEDSIFPKDTLILPEDPT